MKQLFLSVFVVVTVFAVTPALAKQCRATTYQGANAALLTGRYIKGAKDNAVISWEARVLTSIGPDYANWGKAIGKKFRCVKRAGRFKCTARARPCKP